jgi:hypothetical protein
MDLSGQLYGRTASSHAKSPGTHRAKGSNQRAWTFKHRAGTNVTWWGSNAPPTLFIPVKIFFGHRFEERHIKMRWEWAKGFMYTNSWFKSIFFIFLIRLLRKLKLLLPMVDFAHYKGISRRSQWPRGLRRGSAAPRLLRMWVRIPSAEWKCLFWVFCVVR